MKNLLRAMSVVFLAGLLLAGFTACPTDAESSDEGSSRTPLTDGTYVTEGIGKSVTTPMTVSTTFVNSTIVNISIGNNGETAPILDSVKSLLIPRIIEAQSIGLDVIAGATMSSAGVKQAVAAAIDAADGNSEEWYTLPPKSDKKVTLTGYDVIVVGLGGAGMSAYLKAADNGAKVYGIEVGGKIGGNTATAGGPLAINSEGIKNLYTNGADYVNRDGLLKQWYADMKAEVPAAEIPSITEIVIGEATYPVPAVGTPVAPYAGGPKWQIIKELIDESGETVTWLMDDYSFHFCRPMGLGYTQFQIVTNYGDDHWTGGAYGSDDNSDLYKTRMFTMAIERAKAKNAKNDYMLELRAESLITNQSTGAIAGVQAKYRDGTVYEIYGKTVILATGGFIGNRDMKMEHYGADLKTEAVDTERGDGIKMAQSIGAGTYNIKMPATVHIANIKNIIQERVDSDPVKDLQKKATLTSLMLKGDNVVVALNKGQAGDLVGKRFSNEGSGMMGGIAFESWRAGGYFAAIFSNDLLDKIKTNGAEYAVTNNWFALTQGAPIPAKQPIAELDAILDMGERYGNVVRANTLDDLAAQLNVDPAILKNTVAGYNAAVDDPSTDDPALRKDAVFDFGSFSMQNFYKNKIDPAYAGGYTAILGAGYFYGSGGGLDIDVDMQVLNASKAKIRGLYAVGQDSMGVLFNDKLAYVGYGAAAQGWAITSGRIAGEKAAAEAAAMQ